MRPSISSDLTIWISFYVNCLFIFFVQFFLLGFLFLNVCRILLYVLDIHHFFFEAENIFSQYVTHYVFQSCLCLEEIFNFSTDKSISFSLHGLCSLGLRIFIHFKVIKIFYIFFTSSYELNSVPPTTKDMLKSQSPPHPPIL